MNWKRFAIVAALAAVFGVLAAVVVIKAPAQATLVAGSFAGAAFMLAGAIKSYLEKDEKKETPSDPPPKEAPKVPPLPVLLLVLVVGCAASGDELKAHDDALKTCRVAGNQAGASYGADAGWQAYEKCKHEAGIQ